MAQDLPKPMDDPERALRVEEELPVVMRMVIEVRSDGVKTMARGAVEDVINDHKVAIELPAMSPLQLSAALSETIGKTLLDTPGLAKAALKSLVPDPLRRLKRKILGQSSQPE